MDGQKHGRHSLLFLRCRVFNIIGSFSISGNSFLFDRHFVCYENQSTTAVYAEHVCLPWTRDRLEKYDALQCEVRK